MQTPATFRLEPRHQNPPFHSEIGTVGPPWPCIGLLNAGNRHNSHIFELRWLAEGVKQTHI